jgi:hypothetical protein
MPKSPAILAGRFGAGPRDREPDAGTIPRNDFRLGEHRGVGMTVDASPDKVGSSVKPSNHLRHRVLPPCSEPMIPRTN